MRHLGRLLLGMDPECDVVELMWPGEPDATGFEEDGGPGADEAAAAADEAAAAAEPAPGNGGQQEPTCGEPAQACKQPPESSAAGKGHAPEDAAA